MSDEMRLSSIPAAKTHVMFIWASLFSVQAFSPNRCLALYGSVQKVLAPAGIADVFPSGKNVGTAEKVLRSTSCLPAYRAALEPHMTWSRCTCITTSTMRPTSRSERGLDSKPPARATGLLLPSARCRSDPYRVRKNRAARHHRMFWRAMSPVCAASHRSACDAIIATSAAWRSEYALQTRPREAMPSGWSWREDSRRQLRCSHAGPREPSAEGQFRCCERRVGHLLPKHETSAGD